MAKKNEIVFNSAVFGFMVNGEPIGVEFHNEGKGKIDGRTYGNTYQVVIEYQNVRYTWRTSQFANKSNAQVFIEQLLKEQANDNKG